MTKAVPSKALECINLTLGAVLFIAPFATGLVAGPVAVWNACFIGALIVLCSAIAIWKYSNWAEWTNVIAGCWLVIAPFALGFATVASAMWVHVLLGLSVATIAGFQISKARDQNAVKLTR